MLRLEARQERYDKAEHNARLRRVLGGRSKGSVEFKHHNISAVLNGLDLPFIPGYKPRGNSQLLLRKAVQRFVLEKAGLLQEIVTAFEDVKTPAEATFKAVLVEAPSHVEAGPAEPEAPRLRLPRRVDFAARDEANRTLGRAGEHWTLGFEQRRLAEAGQSELFQAVDWVSERLGDGAGFDILSFDAAGKERFIEVKTTNGAKATPFVISRNEVEFSREAAEQFHLYRVFQFRQRPMLYILSGDVARQLHLEPIDFRASFRRLRT